MVSLAAAENEAGGEAEEIVGLGIGGGAYLDLRLGEFPEPALDAQLGHVGRLDGSGLKEEGE